MVKEFTYKNHLARIIYDDASDTVSPREWDNMGTLVCFHRTYDYTDKKAPKINPKDFDSLEEVKEHLIKVHGAVLVIPVYMYSHSGVSISTSPFSCPFDSGQLGWIYATRDAILSSYGKKRLSKSLTDQADRDLKGEVETLNQWVSGEVYAYVIDPQDDDDTEGIHELNCGGYFDLERTETAAQEAIDSLTAFDEEQEFIKNLPVKELPKYVNHKWKFPRASVDTFKNRLKELQDDPA